MKNALAIVHPTGLLAKELQDSLEQRRELWSELRLLTSHDEEIGALTEVAGAAAMVAGLETDALAGVDVVFFCGSIEHNRPLVAALPPATTAVILSPDATPEDGLPIVAGVNLAETRPDAVLLSPHPGAVALTHLLHPLRLFEPRRAVVTLLEPASAIGSEALDEVLEQTRSILAFQGDMPRAVHGAQLAFNVLPGGTPTGAITALTQRVLEWRLPIAIQILKAGIFHSYGISLHVEVDEDPGIEALREALAAHPMIELVDAPDLLGPIDSAARGELLVGTVAEADDGGYWIWAVMDNLTRGGAANAVRILEAIQEERFVH